MTTGCGGSPILLIGKGADVIGHLEGNGLFPSLASEAKDRHDGLLPKAETQPGGASTQLEQSLFIVIVLTY